VSLTVCEAAGSPKRVGEQYGEALAGAVTAALGYYEALAAAKGIDLQDLSAGAARFIDAARLTLPRVVDELEGLAAGAGIPLDAAVFLNCLEEVWPDEGDRLTEACTTIVAGPFLLHAEQWYGGHEQIGVITARPEGVPPFVSPTCAGFMPAVGMNASGFAQGIDSLTASDDAVGIPRVMISRLTLGAHDLEGAISAACTPGRAGGYAHVLASVDHNVVVETSASTAAILDGVAAHTNHYLSRTPMARPPSAGSAARLARAQQLLVERPPATLEDCTDLLADHEGSPESICVHETGIDGSATVFGMACDVENRRMVVSDGSPCCGRWEEFAVPSWSPAAYVV
jgi:isopenicillin-N N-acyltransferase like protein